MSNSQVDYAKLVEELLKMPQELCKMCGLCCKVASYKGGMSFEEIQEIANDFSNPTQADGAKDFLTIFAPISDEEAMALSPEFVESVYERFPESQNKECFFKCRFMNEARTMCAIHEDRPMLCRMYPIPHERTFYHGQCGFKQQGRENWQKIIAIMLELQAKSQRLEDERKATEERSKNLHKEEL